MQSAPRPVIFDLGVQDLIDVTSGAITKGLVKELHGNGIEVYIADVHAPVLETGSKDHVFPTVDAAMHFIETCA